MTVHAGTHIDSPHHFFRDKPSIEQLPLESMMGKAVVLDLTAKGIAHASISPDDLDEAERKLKQQGVEIQEGGMLLLRTDWPKGHDTTDPKWWNDSPYLTKQVSLDGGRKQKAVRRRLRLREKEGATIRERPKEFWKGHARSSNDLPKRRFQIENLMLLDQIGAHAGP